MKKIGVPKEIQANHSFCNHYSKEQNLCCRGALLPRARLVFQVPHHLVFLKTAGPQTNSQSSEHRSSHGCDICQDQFAHVLHHLAVNPRTHLQLKKTTEPDTSQCSEKSIF